jgi:ribulose 1,5-bisphosphate synthetase/thiazole synthase
MTTITRKNLGQSAPNATTETDLYTVPASTSAVISSLVVCNRGAVVATFRVSVAVGGGATGNKDYLYYDVLIPPNDTFIATVGLTLAATDKVKVYASTANLSLNLFGEEVL